MFWQPWIIDSYWLKSLPATAAGINLWLKWVFIPECRPHMVPVRQSPTSSRQICSCCYHMPKVVSFHMPGLDWELQLRCARCLIPLLPADVREVVACPWMNTGGLLMTNLICFNDVSWNHNWELVHLVEFPVKYWTSKFSAGFFQRHMESQESRVHLQNHATNIFSESASGQRALNSTSTIDGW